MANHAGILLRCNDCGARLRKHRPPRRQDQARPWRISRPSERQESASEPLTKPNATADPCPPPERCRCNGFSDSNSPSGRPCPHPRPVFHCRRGRGSRSCVMCVMCAIYATKGPLDGSGNRHSMCFRRPCSSALHLAVRISRGCAWCESPNYRTVPCAIFCSSPRCSRRGHRP